ncbi:HAMP domain-containing histidine kinase [Candidatus Sumerlaeota bacterium]|nr:HAMP domain-containing histidine kinase [Candidatus Sumerlaeota bacterium]
MKILSMRTRFILLCLASIALLGFALAVVTGYAVHRKRMAVEYETRRLIQVNGQKLVRQLEETLSKESASEQESKPSRVSDSALAALRKHLESMDQPFKVYYRIEDLSGKHSIEHEIISLTPNTASASNDPPDTVHSERFMVHWNEQEVGELVVGATEEMVLEQIREYGSDISTVLTMLTAAMFVLMVATFYLLWKAFQHWMQLEHDRERQERMAYIGTLAGGLAHEIRNPLNAMNINLDLIREELEDPREDLRQRTGEMISLLQNEARQLNHTLSDFLSYAMPRNDVMGACDIAAVARQTAALLRPEYERKGAELHVEAPDNLTLLGGSERLSKALANLLLNALQAMRPDDEDDSAQQATARTDLRVKQNGETCVIDVRDTGPGISPDQREKVFEVFHSTKKGGSGFGLAIALRTVESHDGALRIMDVPEGETGAWFRIELPIRKAGN